MLKINKYLSILIISLFSTAAKTAAEATTLNGLQGYLASVSSYAENTFILLILRI